MGIAIPWRKRNQLTARIRRHFAPSALDQIQVSQRKFPAHMRPDLQRALDTLFTGIPVNHFCGIHIEHFGQQINLASLASSATSFNSASPTYEDVDVGEDAPIRCLQNGIWLARLDRSPFIMLLTRGERALQDDTFKVQIGAVGPAGMQIAEQLFDKLAAAIRGSRSYRGKVLSFEQGSRYSGEAQGVKVHKLRTVAREDVILPQSTLDLLDRNVLRFVERRERLGQYGQSRRKGLLFYGPPGTGKTHTLHYLAGALAGHTTLLIAAEQVAHLGEYMTLARLLQPSLVVIEDADLIARERSDMQNPCAEVLLNKLLNEMDGLREDADVLFILTTNRPEALEAALTSRPGRIDQAIEFPLPDDEGRRKLVRLYARGTPMPEGLVDEIVKRTPRVSAAFIKELMRRAVQFHLESVPAGEDGQLQLPDVQNALEEIFFQGGSLNTRLLGAEAVEPTRM